MNSGTRGTFLRSAGVGAAGLALGGWRAEAGAAQARPSLPLQSVEVDCGFKQRTGGDPAELAYGRTVRDKLHRDVLDAIRRARSQGHVVQLEVAADVLNRVVRQADPKRIGELWLQVTGNVGGRYRSREYVTEL